MSNNTVAKRRELAVITKPAVPILAPAVFKAPSANSAALTTPDFGGLTSSKDQDVYLFLENECNGGWHPSFKYGQAAVRSIAHCLVIVAHARYAALQTIYFPVNVQQEHEAKLGTLTGEMEICRRRCADTLASLTSAMDDVRGKSLKMSGNDGPIVRALNHCNGSTKGSGELVYHLADIQETQKNMLSVLSLVEKRWGALKGQISLLKSVLYQQLTLVDEGRRQLVQQYKTAKAKLDSMNSELAQVKGRVQEYQSTLRTVADEKDRTRNRRKHLEATVERLVAQLDSQRQELTHLEKELRERPSEFEEAKKVEMARREEARNKGWSEWAWQRVWYPTEEWTASSVWDNIAREHNAWQTASNVQKLQLQQDIRKAEHDIAQLRLEKQQLFGSPMQRAMQDAEATTLEAKAALMSLQNEYQALELRVEELRAKVHADEDLIAALNDFGEVVPGLCSSLGEAETNVDFSHRAYKHIVLKLEGYSDMIMRVSKQMQKPKLGKDETKLNEDVTVLRTVFLLINDMAGRSAQMSRLLYHEGLIQISSLAPAPMNSSVPGRHIRQEEASKAHKDIHELGQVGEAVVKTFDQEQQNALSRLIPKVHSIANEQNRNSKILRLSSSRNMDWMMKLKKQRIIEDIHELG